MSAYDYTNKAHRNGSGSATFVATDSGDVTLKSAISSLYTIYIKRIVLTIKTDAAQTITFQDTSTTPVFVEKSDTSPGANTQFIWEFTGAGKALGAGKNFIMTFSAAGLAGHMQFEGYQKK